ncbi:Ricin B lectin [Stigmatella aurantiaca DW4/3-1]|uniref:Ricin B lectin n=2 Tax=Stigmatella aurantiaca TaxID=41 RepID=E3FYM2_STIAD|nr:Ricin B lectin [Stigmatella aurantiaca DW4/3-1]
MQALQWMTACAALVAPLTMAHAGSSPQHFRDESKNHPGPSRPPPPGTPHSHPAPPHRPEPPRPPQNGPQLPQRRVRLQSRLADVLISVQDNDRRQGSSVTVSPSRRNARDNATWDLVPASGGFYIQNRETGRVLDIEGANPQPEARVITWPYSGAPNQLWRFVPSSVPGYFYIQSQLNGLVLDIKGGDPQRGAQLISYPMKHSDADNQLWRVVSR